MGRLDGFEGRWQRETEAVLSGMKDWRLQHPRATLAEIEAALDERLEGLRARLLEDLALASAVAEVSGPGTSGHGARAAGSSWRLAGDTRERW